MSDDSARGKVLRTVRRSGEIKKTITTNDPGGIMVTSRKALLRGAAGLAGRCRRCTHGRSRGTSQQKPPIKIGLLRGDRPARLTGAEMSMASGCSGSKPIRRPEPQCRGDHRRYHLQSGPGTCPSAPARSPEKVNFLVGPLCGHEGPAVAQVSRRDRSAAGHGCGPGRQRHKWERTPTVCAHRGKSSSQISHPSASISIRTSGCATYLHRPGLHVRSTRSRSRNQDVYRSRRQSRAR